MKAMYTITRYNDGEPLADISMAPSAYDEYMRQAQQPEGLMTLSDLGSLMHNGTPEELDDLPGDTVIFLQDS